MSLSLYLGLFLLINISSHAAVIDSQEKAIADSSALNAKDNSLSASYESPEQVIGEIICPHTATYKISLDKKTANDGLDNAYGSMTIKILDTGDGWVYEQNSTLLIYFASDEVEQINTNVATWQDYEGNHYRFNSRTLRNGQEEEVIRGEAHKGAENASGKIIYKLPNQMEIDIPNETVFPLHHLIYALRQANRGQTVISNIVFDGSAETQEAVEVSTIMSPVSTIKLKLEEAEPKGIMMTKLWQMTLGIYSLNSNVAEPEYQIQQNVMDNGIINEMTLDYGDFQVLAKLEKVEVFT